MYKDDMFNRGMSRPIRRTNIAQELKQLQVKRVEEKSFVGGLVDKVKNWFN